jgi:hypothetical protein
MIIAVVIGVVMVLDVFLFLFIRKLKIKGGISLHGALSPVANSNSAAVAAETHSFKLAPDAMKRAKEMKHDGASTDDICRAIVDNYDALGESDKHALHMLVDTMAGGIGNAIATSFSAHEASFKLPADAIARAKELFAGGASPDDICREVVPGYAGWDPSRQENMRWLVEKFLKSQAARP